MLDAQDPKEGGGVPTDAQPPKKKGISPVMIVGAVIALIAIILTFAS